MKALRVSAMRFSVTQQPHLSLVAPPARFEDTWDRELPGDLVDGPGPAAYVVADGGYSAGEVTDTPRNRLKATEHVRLTTSS